MDVSKAIVQHLKNALGVRVATERPATALTPLVTIVRGGGGGDRFREQARYSIHAWEKTETEAYKLGMQVADAMFDLPASEVNIANVEQDSFYSNIYEDGTRRWTGVYIITNNR